LALSRFREFASGRPLSEARLLDAAFQRARGGVMTISSDSAEDERVTVLVAEDEELFRGAIERMLRRRGIVATVVPDGLDALAALEREPFDVVLADVHMRSMGGPELLSRVKESGCSSEMVMMSASPDVSIAVAAVKAGAYGFLTKPFSEDALIIELRNAARTKRLRETAQRLQRQLEQLPTSSSIVGNSPRMQDVFRRVAGVAKTESTILVLGESGTGKEVIATAIHERSRRATKPFVCVNCGAIAPELVESELFGHARGAFTSAVSSRAGLFEAANGGTLFLDEIGELPMSAQVKLLRVLQEGEIKPVGSDHSKSVDVRVIAATNADLKAATVAGTFRKDLYYRLNVIPIQLPPLRERGDDVLLLARHFLQRYAERTQRGAMTFNEETSERLLAHAWPGNVRELAHAIEHAVVLAPSNVITPADLPPEVRSTAASPHVDDASAMSLVRASSLHTVPYLEAKQRMLAQFNEAYITALLEECGGNISEAARRSGVDRSNLRRLMRTHYGDATLRKRTSNNPHPTVGASEERSARRRCNGP
jgi:two-component system, NtrC family, response regulator HydG